MSVSYGLFKSRFKKTIADTIYNEIITKTSRYYHFLGKENAWTDFLSPFIPSQTPEIGDVPGAPSDNFRYELHVRRDILTTKFITPSDVAYVVPRIDWVSGTVYDMYDDAISANDPAPSGAVRLEDAHFYVLTKEYNVYKCINNNYRVPSIVEPTGTGISVFSTPDGYIWKFMYTIPISLRNRFLSSTYMPVTTSLRTQFYSDGEIVQIDIVEGGSGYINPQLIVTGTGYIKNNPYAIDSILISNPGHGYTSAPTITFSEPSVDSINKSVATATATISGGQVDIVTLITSGYGYTADPVSPVITVSEPIIGAIPYLQSTPYNLNQVVKYEGNYYKVTTAGTSDASHPTHTTGTVTIGSVEFEYIATIAVLEPVMIKTEADMDALLGPGGQIVGIIINDGGTGYTTANIQVIDPVPPPKTFNAVTDFVPGNHSIAYPDGSLWSGNSIRIITAPSASGMNLPGNLGEMAIALRSAKIGDKLNIISDVSGPQTLTLTRVFEETLTNIFEATVDKTATTNNYPETWENFITSIEYERGPANAGGTGAVLSPNFSVGNIDTLQANVELLSVPGTIDSMIVVDGGIGYGAATVSILGDGYGCTADAVVIGGKVVAINITNPGYGYTWTDVVISGNGSGAIVRAIMSPLGGHGYNAVDELNASSIMFYSAFSRDINHGLNVTNDYRKAGLLKNIRKFGSTTRFNEDVGSGCVLITGTFDKIKIAYDQLLVHANATYKKYRVVEFNDTQILLSVFNNFTVAPGDALITPEGYIINISKVEERTIDQFSGDFLFLTVREPFAPSEEQIVTVRTVLTV